MSNVTKRITEEDVEELLLGFDMFDFGVRTQPVEPKKERRATKMDNTTDTEIASMIEESRLKIQGQLEQYEETIKKFIDSSVLLQNLTSNSLGKYTGPVYGWEYWIPEEKAWGMTVTEGAARKMSGMVRRAWLWYDNGKPIRELVAEEIVKYCP